MSTVYLSLGSNLGNREANLGNAISLLESRDLSITRVSSIYETDPIEAPDQQKFLNLAAEARTDLHPHEMLQRTSGVEAELGRERKIPKGPRTIDIDILLYEELIIESRELTVPHPRMHLRRFVLEPLAELAPTLRHPQLDKSMRELLDGTMNQIVRLYSRRLSPG